jgi:hypothetical protein
MDAVGAPWRIPDLLCLAGDVGIGALTEVMVADQNGSFTAEVPAQVS